MFNEEIKSKFISEFSTSVTRRHAAVVMFNAVEKFETKWGKDICTANKTEIQPIIEEIIGLRSSSKKLRLSILKEYIHWCIDHHIEGATEEIFEIEDEDLGLEKVKKQMVANPQHLQRYLNCICESEKEKTVDCIYRCFYWLAYSGLHEEDAFKIRSEDIDLENMVIKYNNQEYLIYREAIPAFKNCVTLTRFRYKHPNYSADKIIYKDRAPGNMLLRGIGNTKSVKAVRVDMSRRARNPKFKSKEDEKDSSLDLKLSFYRVWLSGLFYRTYEAERAGMPADFLTIAEDFMEGKTYKLDSGRNTIGAKQRQLARDYLEDYNRWKEAYSI